MITQIADEDRLKTILREVLVEVLDQRRDWFTAVVAEAMEDAALVRAIKEGEETDLVSRDEIFKLLGGKACLALAENWLEPKLSSHG